MNNEKGFTLIELIVVMVVIIVAIGVGISSYIASLPHLRLVAATRDFVGDLRYAQQIAAKENRTVRLTLRTATTYEIVRIAVNEDPFGALVDDVSVKTVDLNAKYEATVQFGGVINNNSIYFGKLGAVDTSTFTTAVEAPVDYCGGEFRANIDRVDGLESKRVCINNGGRIRIP